MQIKEIEEKLGISEAMVDKLIKKPVAERLLNPSKNERGFYDYTVREIHWLKRYKVLRIATLQYMDFLSIEKSGRTLSDVLRDRLSLLEDKMEMNSKSIELCRRLLENPVDYETFPAEELFAELCTPNHSTDSPDRYGVEDTHPISLERAFFCPSCGERFIVDLADYVYNEYSNDEPMGQEIVYEYSTEDMCSCPFCKRTLQISGYTSEYPIGGFNSERIVLKTQFGN